jgi:hypothetical protein
MKRMPETNMKKAPAERINTSFAAAWASTSGVSYSKLYFQ